MKKNWIIFVIALLIIGISFVFLPRYLIPPPLITSYEECVKADNPILMSYPPQCKTKDGKNFTQDIGNELELADQILITSPRPNQLIKSPLVISGKARGTWFFEAVFSARLVDDSNASLGTAILTADGEWMTENFVPFNGPLTFTTTAKRGKLILEKANPSGLPENDQSLIVPVKFRED